MKASKLIAPSIAAAVLLSVTALLPTTGRSVAQTPPNKTEIREYKGLLAAAIKDDADDVKRLLAAGANANETDSAGRTPLHVAAYRHNADVARALVAGGGNPRALDGQLYDIVTIAAVANDVPFLKVALELGGNPREITSPYGGTALIAASHLGHAEVVRELLKAGAPVDHINKLGWTALIEAVKLGDGGPRYVETVTALLAYRASPDIADRSGLTPLRIAQSRGYTDIARLIESAGGH